MQNPAIACSWASSEKPLLHPCRTLCCQHAVFVITGAMLANNDSGSDVQESGLDTCAICLEDTGQDEAFLDNCYHRFHWRCASSWTEVQRSHPSSSIAPFCCPLCKAPYTSILHGFQDDTFRQEWVVPGLHTFAPSLVLTPEQRRRRSLYFQPPPTESTANSRVECTAVVSSAEVQTWITRELQAITLEEDVKLLCQVVLGCLAAVAQSLHNSGQLQPSSWTTAV